MDTTIYIKDMVCVRCIMAVEDVLRKAGVEYSSVELGWAKLKNEVSPVQKQMIREGLHSYALEIIEDKTQVLLEKIKTEINKIVHASVPLQLKLSAHLSQVLGYNYTYLANTFSEQEGITLERYFIAQRIERVKELIVYEEMSLSGIRDELSFSSISHLCLQFKKVTGLTPADFRKQSQSENFIWRKQNTKAEQ